MAHPARRAAPGGAPLLALLLLGAAAQAAAAARRPGPAADFSMPREAPGFEEDLEVSLGNLLDSYSISRALKQDLGDNAGGDGYGGGYYGSSSSEGGAAAGGGAGAAARGGGVALPGATFKALHPELGDRPDVQNLAPTV